MQAVIKCRLPIRLPVFLCPGMDSIPQGARDGGAVMSRDGRQISAPAISALPPSMVVGRKLLLHFPHSHTSVVVVFRQGRQKIAPAFSALPTSDLHGWRKCNRIVGTIVAMWVGRKLLHAFSALPTSMWVVFARS